MYPPQAPLTSNGLPFPSPPIDFNTTAPLTPESGFCEDQNLHFGLMYPHQQQTQQLYHGQMTASTGQANGTSPVSCFLVKLRMVLNRLSGKIVNLQVFTPNLPSNNLLLFIYFQSNLLTSFFSRTTFALCPAVLPHPATTPPLSPSKWKPLHPSIHTNNLTCTLSTLPNYIFTHKTPDTFPLLPATSVHTKKPRVTTVPTGWTSAELHKV